jgi:hypothetical protein
MASEKRYAEFIPHGARFFDSAWLDYLPHDRFLDEAEQHLHGADLRPELSPDREEGAAPMPTPEPDS